MSKVTERYVPVAAVFAGTALVGLATATSLAATGMELGLNLTIVGLALAIVLPLALELRNRSSRARRVVILDYRAHHYGHAVARGALRTFNAEKRRWSVEYKAPTAPTGDGAVAWQVREVQAALIDDVDGILLVPAADDRDLWFALAAAGKTKMFTVVVDTKPPNQVFRSIGLEPPRFVSARYNQTGEIIGDLLVGWMRENQQRECILWTGPSGSYAGEERSRNILYKLTGPDYLDRVTRLPMGGWAPDAQICRDTIKHVESAPAQVAVYAGDDENAMALHWFTVSEYPHLRPKMFIIGCNGTPDDWGHVPSLTLRTVDATVDIMAEEQGVQAALLFVKERNGKLSPSERSTFISPELARPAGFASNWLEGIFAKEVETGSERTIESITLDEEGRLKRTTLVEDLAED